MFELYLKTFVSLGLITGDRNSIQITPKGRGILSSALGSVVSTSYHDPVSQTADLATGKKDYGDHKEVKRGKLLNGAGSDLQVAQRIAPGELDMIDNPGRYFEGQTLEAMSDFSGVVIYLGSGSALMGRTIAQSNRVERIYNSDWRQEQLDLGKRNAIADNTIDKMVFKRVDARNYDQMKDMFKDISREHGKGPHILSLSSFLHDAGSGPYAKEILEIIQKIVNELDLVIVILTHENSKIPLEVRKQNLSSFETPFGYLHDWSDQDLRVFLERLVTQPGEESLEALLIGPYDRPTVIAAIHSSIKARGYDLRDENFKAPPGKGNDFWYNRLLGVGSMATLMKKVA